MAFNKTKSIKEEIKKDLILNIAAIKYSQDPSAKDNKGELGYFSAFRMVYPFESAAYKTTIG